MEHKGNYILLTGLLIITLVVTVVGTTFSYFSVTNKEKIQESTIQVTNGILVFKCDPDIRQGMVNAGEVIATKNITINGTITGSDQLNYELDLNVSNNTYANETLFYTLTSTNTSSNGMTIPSITSNTPVVIPTGQTSIKIGTGSFTGPVENGAHTYVLRIYRGENAFAQPGENSSFEATLDIIQG